GRRPAFGAARVQRPGNRGTRHAGRIPARRDPASSDARTSRRGAVVMLSPARDDADAIVVGAGPAGAATALLLAEQGLRVIVLDRARFPRPKICGEYLSPEAARVLDRLGVLKDVDAAGAQPLRGMRLVAPDGTVLCAQYPTSGPWRGYRDHALAIPREIFDRLLLDHARSMPIDVRERHRVTGLKIEGSQVTGVEGTDVAGRPFELSARLVVGADGRASIVARTLGLVRAHRLKRMALIQDVTGLEGF